MSADSIPPVKRAGRNVEAAVPAHVPFTKVRSPDTEVDRRFAPGAAGDDRVVEAGVRQKADHGAIAIAVGAARGPASLSDQREPDPIRIFEVA